MGGAHPTISSYCHDYLSVSYLEVLGKAHLPGGFIYGIQEPVWEVLSDRLNRELTWKTDRNLLSDVGV